jgi:hypothetical protein
MFGQIFGSLGGKIGGLFGGGILKTIGKFAGRYFGNYLERLLFRETSHSKSEHGIVDDFYNPTAAYGKAIPLIYGSARTNGTLIWASDVQEIRDSKTESKFDNYGLKVSDKTTNNYSYSLTCAIAICEGEISDLGRIWVNNHLIKLENYKHTLYKGKPDQMPNELMEAELGKGKVPAYRDLAYIVFENLPLADFGNHLPVFSFEVFRRSHEIDKEHNSLEKMIKNMIMIPGSGEFVYDTIIQSKIYAEFGVTITSQKINCHNPAKIANALYSLDQLQQYCPDLEWIAPVATWFCNDLDIAKASIYPAVEYKDANTSTTEEWRVGKFTRANARMVSRNELDQPNYGGSVNDASLVRYLQEIKKRGLKILFYPMFFMDVPMKPWRGHVKGNISAIPAFFNKEDGYNNFILHYANLVAPYVDAFIIGSELIGITSITDNRGNYPAVDEFVKLAAKVRKVMGEKVLLTYAADWSEYHHTAGGYYHLDPLWSSKDIDFIGIDAYFPLTAATSSAISEEEVKKGWTSGEGFEYISGSAGAQNKIDPKYAWKNLKYWWENEHVNPDQKKTNWVPKSKKIWFTEFGFPSINKAPNQPNVFFDPKCRDGGVPRGSNGVTDFSIQRICLKASLEHFETEECLEKAFIWTWDARPYPAWPHSDAWGDGYLWEKGHWLNGKLSGSSLEIVVADLCKRAGLEADRVGFVNMDQKFDGMLIQGKSSVFDVIEMLRGTYFFDISTRTSLPGESHSGDEAISKGHHLGLPRQTFSSSQGQFHFCFIKRGKNISAASLAKKDLIRKDPYYIVIDQIADSGLICNIRINYISAAHNYDSKNIMHLENDRESCSKNEELNLPIMMSESEAMSLANALIKNSAYEREVLNFRLPFNYIYLETCDIIDLEYEARKYRLRIVSIEIEETYIDIIAVPEKSEIYHIIMKPESLIEKQFRDPKVLMLNSNIGLSYEDFISKKFNRYIVSDTKADLYLSEDGESFGKVSKQLRESKIGEVLKFIEKSQNMDYIIDDTSEIIVSFERDAATKDSAPEILHAGFEAQICGEIIYCADVETLDDGKFKLKKLYRNLYNSKRIERNMDFIVIDKAKIAQISDKYRGIKVNAESLEIRDKPPAFMVSDVEVKDRKVKWLVRHPYVDDWRADIAPNDAKISYIVRVGVREYIVDHDYTKATQEFDLMNDDVDVGVMII